MPSPLDDARAILVLASLLYRARRDLARHGVQPAPAAVAALVPIGQALRAAVAAAERGEEDALERVALAAEELSQAIEPWDSLRGMIGVAIGGVRGQRVLKPGR